MALLFIDSFDHYATADLAEKWTSVFNSGNATIGAYGRNSTNGIRMSTGNCHVSSTVLGGVSEAIVGVAIKISQLGSAMGMIGFGSAGTWECGIVLQADGTFRPFVVSNSAYNLGEGLGNITLIGTSSSAGLQAGVWAYLECQMKCDGSTGTCTVRLNGTQVLADTALDTLYTSATLTRAAIGSTGAGTRDFDDLYIASVSGGLVTAFLGDVTVSAIYPNGAGNSTGWTPSAGSNYQCVDEAVVNDDTDYVSTSVNTTKDLYAFGDAPVGADIRGVQLLIAARKGADGPGQITPVVRSNSTDYDQTAQGLGGTTYQYLRTMVEADPATSAAWTESGFNAAEFGAKKTG